MANLPKIYIDKATIEGLETRFVMSILNSAKRSEIQMPCFGCFVSSSQSGLSSSPNLDPEDRRFQPSHPPFLAGSFNVGRALKVGMVPFFLGVL